MNYLTGNLVAEMFPESARILCGLSKYEFASEPEIMITALRNGMFKAAAAVGHTSRIVGMLKNTRLTSAEIHDAMMLACQHKHHDIIRLLLNDDRLTIRDLKIGCMSADVVAILFENPAVIPTDQDIRSAVFGPHGGQKRDDGIYSNSLDTARLILAHPRLELSEQFCRDIWDSVIFTFRYVGILLYTPGNIPAIFHEEDPYFTNYIELSHVLLTNTRFQEYSEDIHEIIAEYD